MMSVFCAAKKKRKAHQTLKNLKSTQPQKNERRNDEQKKMCWYISICYALPPSHVGLAKNSAKSSGDIVPSSSSPSPNRPSSTSTSESCSEDLGRDSGVVIILAPLQVLPIDEPRLVPPHAVVPTVQEATLGARPTPAAAAASRAAGHALHLMLGEESRGRGASLRNKHRFGASSV